MQFARPYFLFPQAERPPSGGLSDSILLSQQLGENNQYDPVDDAGGQAVDNDRPGNGKELGRQSQDQALSPKTQSAGITVNSQRQGTEGKYYGVSAYNIEIRNNQITGVRGSVPQGNTEAPPASGLVSWSGQKSSDPISEAYSGDNTKNEVREDIEISLAALQQRAPELSRRNSPNQNQAAFGNQ